MESLGFLAGLTCLISWFLLFFSLLSWWYNSQACLSYWLYSCEWVGLPVCDLILLFVLLFLRQCKHWFLSVYKLAQIVFLFTEEQWIYKERITLIESSTKGYKTLWMSRLLILTFTQNWMAARGCMDFTNWKRISENCKGIPRKPEKWLIDRKKGSVSIFFPMLTNSSPCIWIIIHHHTTQRC